MFPPLIPLSIVCIMITMLEDKFTEPYRKSRIWFSWQKRFPPLSKRLYISLKSPQSTPMVSFCKRLLRGSWHIRLSFDFQGVTSVFLKPKIWHVWWNKTLWQRTCQSLVYIWFIAQVWTRPEKNLKLFWKVWKWISCQHIRSDWSSAFNKPNRPTEKFRGWELCWIVSTYICQNMLTLSCIFYGLTHNK